MGLALGMRHGTDPTILRRLMASHAFVLAQPMESISRSAMDWLSFCWPWEWGNFLPAGLLSLAPGG